MEGQSKLMRKMIKILKPENKEHHKSLASAIDGLDKDKTYDIKLW